MSKQEPSSYAPWSYGLEMIIEKNGVKIKLNSEEIVRIVEILPTKTDR